MIFYWLNRIFFLVFARVFLHLKVEGRENLPRQGGFILAANHASGLDPIMIIAAIPRYIRWVVIYEYYDLWHSRWLLRQMRFIRIGKNLPKEAFRALLQGEIIGIFPEGRRTWSGNLGPGRPGVATLARRTSSPVVPIGVLGTYTCLPRTRKRLKIHPVTVRIGAPLFFPESADKKGNQRIDQENTQKIMQHIAELLY